MKFPDALRSIFFLPPAEESGTEYAVDKGTYEMGYALGRHWAQRDATLSQLHRVRDLGEGKVWVANRSNPAVEFTRTVDPGKSDFLGTGTNPPESFVAGFVNGARAIEPASHRSIDQTHC